ncbi:ArsA family ATPase [Clostridiisalibacter paucivorans]|uniref:ArsA family ATPase n=1 Tax=Clostridiisalibacter paucivorans TaxID=408753 RepID=UPI000686C463|nr:TRC40/GET3/ArsA family transport-energizing ATPase [Clostridiisalibacter paucivorans]
MKKIVFFGGKGGVGKTTCSAAFAIHCANQGEKTLLVSTDPAHSTSDIFETEIGSDVVKLRENLYSIEIDADRESEKYIDGIRKNLSRIISPIILEEIKRQLDAAAISPGTQESAMFDKMVEIINEKSNEYDRIIFDTAPTGHTIRLLSLPELLGGWIDSLLKRRRKIIKLKQMVSDDRKKDEELINEDPILKILNRRKENMERARKIIIDEERLSFVFVLNAERLPIEETKKAINVLKKYNLSVNYLIVNRILPTDLKDDFWIKKKTKEKEYISIIKESFKDKKIITLPMLQDDMEAKNIDEISPYFKDFL